MANNANNTESTEVIVPINQTTDVAPIDQQIEFTVKEKVEVGTVLTLAVVGLGFLGKKAYDAGKSLYESHKAKKALKSAQEEAKIIVQTGKAKVEEVKGKIVRRTEKGEDEE